MALENCSAVDLFCGVGGLTYGLINSGIKVVAGIDVDPKCHYPFEANNDSTFIEKSITEVSGNELAALYPAGHTKVLVGCAPCQDFSKMSRAKRAADSDKWALLREFSRLTTELRPDVISMENVPEIASHVVYEEFLKTLHKLGYQTFASIIHCPAYGVPQKRDRFVLFASLLGPIRITSPFCLPNEYPAAKTVLNGLEELKAGGTSSTDRLHRSSKLSDLNLKRIRASKPGGTWRDWPKELRCLCHQKATGETYPSVYGRMESDRPAPTMTTQYFGYGNGRFGHPSQDRAISLREGALLQSFPENYQFLKPEEPVAFSTVGRLVGNAVPPRLGLAVGETIRDHIENWRIHKALPAKSITSEGQ